MSALFSSTRSYTDYALLPAQHMKVAHIPAYEVKMISKTPQIVISIPHGGFTYCDELASETYAFLDRLRSLEDSGTNLLRDMINIDNSALISAALSRALLDLNRPASALDPLLYKEELLPPNPHDRFTRYIHAGYGVAPRLCAQKKPLYKHPLAFESTQNLIDRFYKPYHDKLASLLNEGVRHHGQVILLDIHSMPPHYAGKNCLDFIFGDHFGRCLPDYMRQTITSLVKNTPFSHGWNYPYAGGYITTHYGDIHGSVYSVQIEINRALYCKGQNKVSCEALRMIAQLISQIAQSLSNEVGSRLAAE